MVKRPLHRSVTWSVGNRMGRRGLKHLHDLFPGGHGPPLFGCPTPFRGAILPLAPPAAQRIGTSADATTPTSRLGCPWPATASRGRLQAPQLDRNPPAGHPPGRPYARTCAITQRAPRCRNAFIKPCLKTTSSEFPSAIVARPSKTATSSVTNSAARQVPPGFARRNDMSDAPVWRRAPSLRTIMGRRTPNTWPRIL